jgi:hypothetical protein
LSSSLIRRLFPPILICLTTLALAAPASPSSHEILDAIRKAEKEKIGRNAQVRIMKVDPSPGSETLSENASFKITFNAAPPPELLLQTRLQGERGLHPVRVTADIPNMAIDVAVKERLEPGSAYTLELFMNGQAHRFRYRVPARASDALLALQYGPPDSSRGVSALVRPYAEFSMPLDPTAINSSSVRLVDENGRDVKGSLSYLERGKRVTFKPSEPLEPLRKYTMIFSRAIRSEKGAMLEQTVASAFIVSSEKLSQGTLVAGGRLEKAGEEELFKSESGKEVAEVGGDGTGSSRSESLGSRLKILTVFPEDGASIYPGDKLIVSFSRPIEESSLTVKTFALTNAGRNICGRYVFPNPNTVMFVPAEELPEGPCELEISEVVRDRYGAYLDEPVKARFRVVPYGTVLKRAPRQ